MALSSRRQKNKKTVVSAGNRSTALEIGLKASLQPSSHHTVKHKSNELASSGGSMETANRRPASGAWSAPLPAIPSITDKQAAVGSPQLGPSEEGVKYKAVLPGSVAPLQPSSSLKPTAVDTEMLEPGISSQKTNRRMCIDVSLRMTDKPVGTTHHAQVANTCTPAGERHNNTAILT